MKKNRRRKCRHCRTLFRPDPRNRRHQRYCSKPACRRASKAASQRRWLGNPANRDYFRGPAHVERVPAWRARHPGYWRAGAVRRRALDYLRVIRPKRAPAFLTLAFAPGECAGASTAQSLEACAIEQAPQYLIRDRDAIYSEKLR